MLSRQDALDILGSSGCSEKVIAHCVAVADLALEMALKLRSSGRDVDVALVEAGALLHDLGRARTHDITHAIAGVEVAEQNGIDQAIIEIIKRHIGAGITREDAKELGLPDDDYMPVTIEQMIVAHADNLVKGTKRITLEERILKMQENNLDPESIERVKALAEELGTY
ncbi:TIGR00295 family protein [Methanolobus sp. WCC4]|uniref:TIGR00295 family protein n=1 Tax=Methanolobus sp. WCC4 TaxID=3125784 RepID=UPI0030F742CD